MWQHWEVNTDSSTYKEVIDIKQQRRRDFMSVRLAAAYLTHDLKTFVGDAGLKSKKNDHSRPTVMTQLYQ